MSASQLRTSQRISQRRHDNINREDLTRDQRIEALVDDINVLGEWALTDNELLEMKAVGGVN